MEKGHHQYTAVELADRILRKVNRPAGDTINHIKLQALLYYCEAWSLAVFDRELFAEEIQGWDHGPVVHSVWDKLSIKGWNDLEADDLGSPTELDAETEDLLNDVFLAYGEFPATELEKMIKKDATWKEARQGLQPWDLTKRPINKTTIGKFYKSAYETEQNAHSQGQGAPEAARMAHH